ncbi:hypothetical protein ACFFX0_26825 [Citricoccus parietis]|uniref:Uncharacterized protein n=1 Tax=Citricoccus parietis TaxID=592307 RepID=A0ABV5G6N6_9MICC
MRHGPERPVRSGRLATAGRPGGGPSSSSGGLIPGTARLVGRTVPGLVHGRDPLQPGADSEDPGTRGPGRHGRALRRGVLRGGQRLPVRRDPAGTAARRDGCQHPDADLRTQSADGPLGARGRSGPAVPGPGTAGGSGIRGALRTNQLAFAEGPAAGPDAATG